MTLDGSAEFLAGIRRRNAECRKHRFMTASNNQKLDELLTKADTQLAVKIKVFKR